MFSNLQKIASVFAIASLTVGILGFPAPGKAQRVVTCQSKNNQYTTCLMVTRNGVRLGQTTP